MNLKNKSKKTRVLSVFIILITIVILFFGILTIYLLKDLENESRLMTIDSRIEEYKLKVDGRINADIEMLSSLAVFFSNGFNLRDEEFLQQFCKSNDENIFLKMAYISNDGFVVRAYKGESYEITDIGNIELKVRESIEQAFNGKKAVSDIFVDRKYNEESIVLSVPVYKNNEVVGVLCGGYTLDILEELINNSKLENGLKENVDLIKKDGTFIVLSEQSLVTEVKKNIFEYDTYSEEQKKDILEKMDNGESFYAYYTVSEKDYLSKYIPTDNFDWYIIYSDTTNKEVGKICSLANFIQIDLIILILVVIIIIFILYRNILANQKQLEKIAYYDSMTGVFSLFKFQQDVKKCSDNIECILNMNISRFRYINAEFGRKNANKVLIIISEIIKKNLKKNEFCGRDGADSFWIAFTDRDKEKIQSRLDNIISEIEETCKSLLCGYKVRVFIGGAFTGNYRIDIMERARFSLREAQKSKNSKITFWTEAEEEISDIRLYVENHKESALINGEFKMYLQPKKNYKSGEIDSAEVLVRWIRPDGTMIFPDQFIPQFEANTFCIQLDLYMFEQACKTIRKWMDENKKVIKLSVNQSRLLFYKDDYVDLLCSIVDKYKVDPKMLTLEILENIGVDNMERMNHVIKKLQEKGFYISMDDFGSGYSSLSCLGSLKVNEIKFDRFFLKELDDDKNNRIIIDNLVKAFKKMNISVVIEGIETQENEEFIKSTEVDYGQGYYYNKPLSLEDFEKQYN